MQTESRVKLVLTMPRCSLFSQTFTSAKIAQTESSVKLVLNMPRCSLFSQTFTSAKIVFFELFLKLNVFIINLNFIDMEKLYLIVALSAIFALNGEAKDRYHKEMNKGIVVRDTLTLNSLEIINLNGHDSIVSMTEEKIPIYRVLTEKRGNAMTPRDWAEYKTENMRHRLHLNNKQTEKLFKLNLMESKERTNYKKEKFAMRARHLKKQMKAEERFVSSLNPVQKVAYEGYKEREECHPLSVKCCKVKGHGKKMVAVRQ